MADPNLDQIGQWLLDNKDKAGTPDFVNMSNAYRQASAGQPDATTAAQPMDLATARKQPGLLNSIANVSDRVMTGAIAGLPDLAGAGYNAVIRAAGHPDAQVGSLRAKMLEQTGAPELGPDASTTQQLLEGGGSALLGGGAGAVRSAIAAAPTMLRSIVPAARTLATTVAVPTVGAHFGGEAGGAIADRLGLDPQTGALLGSLVGGGGAAAGPGAFDRYTHWKYSDQGRPNAPEIAAAAERQGVTPTAGMLGNTDIQAAERQLAAKPGAMSYINDRRQTAQQQMADALDRAAVARGSTDVAPTSGSIGYNVADAARAGRDQLADISSAGQQRLMNQVGPRTPADVSGVLAAMEAIRQRTDPGTAQPIDARMGTLRQMLPRDPEGNVISSEVPYERLKDWRTNLRERSQNYDPVPGRFAGQIYDATTGAMRDAAESSGVSPQMFDNVQARTRGIMGEGGPHGQLDQLAGSEPTTAFNFLRGGEQNPARLRMLQANTGPAMDRISGDYVRQLGGQTLNTQGARGPINFANRWEGIHPEARDVIGGRQAPDINDVASLARSFDYPTSQTGLGRTVGPMAHGAARTITGSEIGGALGHATGIPYASEIGRVAGAYLQSPIAALRGRILQGDTARNALAGGAAPPTMSISDLATALNAAGNAQQRQPIRVRIPTGGR